MLGVDFRAREGQKPIASRTRALQDTFSCMFVCASEDRFCLGIYLLMSRSAEARINLNPKPQTLNPEPWNLHVCAHHPPTSNHPTSRSLPGLTPRNHSGAPGRHIRRAQGDTDSNAEVDEVGWCRQGRERRRRFPLHTSQPPPAFVRHWIRIRPLFGCVRPADFRCFSQSLLLAGIGVHMLNCVTYDSRVCP